VELHAGRAELVCTIEDHCSCLEDGRRAGGTWHLNDPNEEATISFTSPSGVEAALPKNRPPTMAQAIVFSELPGQPVVATSVTCTAAWMAVTAARVFSPHEYLHNPERTCS
jgi:hypothetical protein